jgi:hypothetical protein
LGRRIPKPLTTAAACWIKHKEATSRVDKR